MNKELLNRDTDDLVELSFFMSIAKAISRSKSIEETLKEVMNHIGSVFTPLHWSLLLIDSNTFDLNFIVVIGKNADKLQGKSLPRGEGIAGWIAETGQAAIVEDVSKDKRFSSRVDQYTGFETQSIIGVPLKTNKKVFGVIELINKMNGKPFTPFELNILQTIADFAAIAIEKAYYYRALKKMAITDSLTGAYNRGRFEQLLNREMDMCDRYGTPLSLLMLDVDGFKHINDNFGHSAGDGVLKCLAEILQQRVRKVDSVCRYGGDEFVVILPNTSREQAERARQRILDAIDYENNLGRKIPFSVSVGLHSMETSDRSSLMKLLDSDLYRQKSRKQPKNYEDVLDNLEEMLQEEKRIFHSSVKRDDPED